MELNLHGIKVIFQSKYKDASTFSQTQDESIQF